MSGAAIIDVTQAVATQLNAATLSKPFQAQRTCSPFYATDSNPGLKVFVIGTTQSIDLDNGATRKESLDTYTALVGIYNTIDRDAAGLPDQSKMDEMFRFVQEVIDYLKSNRSILDGSASLSTIDNSATFDPEMLDSKGVFLSVLSLTYRIFR